MMDCIQFRELLDCYVDRELSAPAMSAADEHRRECAACGQAAASLEGLRRELQRTVAAHQPPGGLERRIRQALPGAWHGLPSAWAPAIYFRVAAAAIVVLTLGSMAARYRAEVREGVVGALDRVSVSLSDPTTIVLDATVLCRDCELEARHGVRAPCARIGHHGALATPDGHLWNIVEQPSSTELIHDDDLRGRRVRVRGRLYRDARTIEIDSYQVL
jgi:hypothetical protein